MRKQNLLQGEPDVALHCLLALKRSELKKERAKQATILRYQNSTECPSQSTAVAHK